MTGTLTYEVRRARGEEEMAALIELRHAVFCDEQGVPVREELDGRDHESVHLVAVSGTEVLATCRLLFVGPTVQFSRLAVQRPRAGGASRPRCWSWPMRRPAPAGARRLVLHAQTYARSLYEGAGYEPRGRVFMEAGIEHLAMEKYVSDRLLAGCQPAPMPELRIDPLTGQRVDRRRSAGRAPGR